MLLSVGQLNAVDRQTRSCPVLSRSRRSFIALARHGVDLQLDSGVVQTQVDMDCHIIEHA